MRFIFRPTPDQRNTQVHANARDKELLAMQTIDAQMPIVLNAHKQWIEFTSFCACCKQSHDQALTRGIITQLRSSTAQIEAIGLCQGCQLYTRINYRVNKNFSITALHKGQWVRWVKQRTTKYDRLNQRFAEIFMVVRNKMRHLT
jgi:hypothetical protein